MLYFLKPFVCNRNKLCGWKQWLFMRNNNNGHFHFVNNQFMGLMYNTHKFWNRRFKSTSHKYVKNKFGLIILFNSFNDIRCMSYVNNNQTQWMIALRYSKKIHIIDIEQVNKRTKIIFDIDDKQNFYEYKSKSLYNIGLIKSYPYRTITTNDILSNNAL